jgi:hypothetical protein
MKRKIELTNLFADGKRKEIKYSMLGAHERLGHSNEDATRAMAKAIGMKQKKGEGEPAYLALLEKLNRKM